MFADNQSSVQYVPESRPESKVLINTEDESGAQKHFISMKASIKEPIS